MVDEEASVRNCFRDFVLDRSGAPRDQEYGVKSYIGVVGTVCGPK